MDDRSTGMYQKYVVTRTDGSTRRGHKHENCSFFVLDVDHDKFAIPALTAYADACQSEFPQLTDDIMNMIKSKG